MRQRLAILSILAFTILCGLLGGAVVAISPNPMPAEHAQLLAACIALFSAGGYALLRIATSGTAAGQAKGKKNRPRTK